ncbi:hypothetical protein OC846_003386 [Tilletia horrida]|uniref:DUF7729 domain-containing protein n=1 Tax=Tilletia horrida TaxID=155126 RepID=A0AAN6GS14_9BASI|nr:hypothetical protein OC845_003211 [Tilletia horrida]KAK0551146.1 hypothetical protein OC846_003386 [Tilletia horrida]KAK0566121.1 hypothetical protein OC861_003415 [Tilletia horrida]
MRASTSSLAVAAALAAATTTSSQAAALERRQFGALGSLVNGLSSACIGRIGGIALSGDLSDCLGLSTALSTFTSLSDSDSLSEPIQNYLSSDICPKGVCSASTLSSANDTINQACTDADRASNQGVNIVTGLSLIVNNYDVLRNIACLKENNSSNYCAVDTINLYQAQTGLNVSIPKVIDLVQHPDTLISSLPNPQAFCTNCVDAISSAVYGTALGGPLISAEDSANSTIKNGLVNGCSASFDDGSIPSDVTETAGQAVTSSSSSSAAPSSTSSPASGGGGKGAAVAGLSLSSFNLVAPLTLALGAFAGVALVL